MNGKLIIFSAPSGSGKSTIINYLLQQNLNLAFFHIGNQQSASRQRTKRSRIFLPDP